jgi:hypothetical protein
MPCELGVASLSAPRPASLGLLLIFALGILAAGLRRVLAVDRAAFGIPLAVPPPLARLGGGISWVLAPAGPPSPRGSASRQRFPRAAAGANVVPSPGAARMGQGSPLASHPAGDLQVPVFAKLAESPLYVADGTKKTHVVMSDGFAPCSSATHPASPSCPGDDVGVVRGDCKKSETHAHIS